MNIAHILKDDGWHYIRCYKKGWHWIDYYTKEIIDKKLIYNIENR
jgi:hypothetical protein